MRVSKRLLGGVVAASAVAAIAPQLASSPADAAHFTGGDLVVYRVGNGSAPLTNAAAPVFLDEFAPGGGAAKQSIALPTAAVDGNRILTASGQSRSEGLISRSANGAYVALTGYAAAPGATGADGFDGKPLSLTTTDPATTSRVVGLVDGNGTVDTSTGLSGANVSKIIRSAATSTGDVLYAAGGNGGITATTFGSTSTTSLAGNGSGDLTGLSFQGGSLFTSSILGDRLAKVSLAGEAPTAVTGLPSNLLSYGYSFVDATAQGWNGTAFDTLYLANASNRGGTIDKYSFDGSAWSRDGSVDVPGAFGLVADYANGATSIAVTTPQKLLLFTDTTPATTSFDPAAPSTLATAAANTEFRGVALAPTAVTGPSVFLRAPVTAASTSQGSAGIDVKAYVVGSSVSSVNAKLGTSTVSLTKGAGNVWTGKVPVTTAKVGSNNVTVTAVDATGTRVVSKPVTVTTLVVPAGYAGPGSYAWTTSKATRTGTWTTYSTSVAPGGKSLYSKTKGSTLSAKVYGRSLVLTLTKRKDAGKVTITVDGKATTIDLYASTTSTLTKTFAFTTTGAVKGHTVKLTVTGTRNTKSSGIAVFLPKFEVRK